MTVPEENRPKTEKTEDTSALRPGEGRPEEEEAAGRTMREALDEAGVTPEDYEEK
jgi:hypothetical protein